MPRDQEIEFLRRVWDEVGGREYVIQGEVGQQALEEFFRRNHSLFSRVCGERFELISTSEYYRTEAPKGASFSGVYGAVFDCGENELEMTFTIDSYDEYSASYEGTEAEHGLDEDPYIKELDAIGRDIFRELTITGSGGGEEGLSDFAGVVDLVEALEDAFDKSDVCRDCEVVDADFSGDRLEIDVSCGDRYEYKMIYSVNSRSKATVTPLDVTYAGWESSYPTDLA
jgi:hypothetical protein